MVGHLALTGFLYLLLTVARAPAVWGVGLREDGSNPCEYIEPRISANLSNQFEWPLFFHVVCLVLLGQGSATAAQVGLAWLFIAGRVLHSGVQIVTTSVRWRGLVFNINFLAVLGMWCLLLVPELR